MRYLTLMASLLTLAASARSEALGALARVSIIDRDSGVALRTYYARGEYWVAGNPGARYAIEIRNCAGGRLLAVTSVDGVNVLSGDTAGFGQAGYVFDPGERYQIAGWRKSHTEVADFTFTDARDSYAQRTGRPANIGVIGIALFREQPQVAQVAPAPAPQAPLWEDYAALPRDDAAKSPAPSPEAGANSEVASAARAPASAARLGTGHGEREYSYVSDTEFRRLQPQPNELIRIRYDSYENLVALGIIRRPYPASPVPDPFPESRDRRFVPDPG